MANASEPRDSIRAFLKTLESEGHALEFEAAQAFADVGFEVSQNVGYVDSQSEIGRESDVATYLRGPCGVGWVSVLLAIECKKFHEGIVGVFVARQSYREPIAPTFRIGKYLEGNLTEPVYLDLPVDVAGFKAVLKQRPRTEERRQTQDFLWDAVQQALSARNGLADRRDDSEAVTAAAVLVVDATLVAVENTSEGLVAQPVGSAMVRVAGALGKPQDRIVIVQRNALRDFAGKAKSATMAYLDALGPKLAPHFDTKAARQQLDNGRQAKPA